MGVKKRKKRWIVDFRFNGHRYRKSSPLNTRLGAEHFETTLRTRLAKGEPITGSPEPGNERFKDFVNRWMKVYVQTRNRESEKRAKKNILEKHLIPFLGNMKLREIGTEEIERYQAHKQHEGFVSKTINNHLAVLGKALNSAYEWLLLDRVPKMKRLPTQSRRKEYLTAPEVTALLSNQIDPFWRTMILVAIRTGMRPGEIVGLRWEDIDFLSRNITVCRSIWRGTVQPTKTNKIRTIPIAHDLYEALNAIKKTAGFVFAKKDGSLIGDCARDKALKAICNRFGIRPICWYTLRHTFATILAEQGVPLPAIKELMGHSNISTTMIYAHATQTSLRKAVEIMECVTSRQKNTIPQISGHRMDTEITGNERKQLVAHDLWRQLISQP